MMGLWRLGALMLTAWAATAELRVGRSAIDEAAVKVLVLDDGATRVALVMCDALAVDEASVKTARKQIAAQSAIPEGNIMIAATGVRTSREPSPARMGEAVRKAMTSLQAATASAGSGKEDATGFYNRFLMKDGTVRANPGRLNPDVVQPAGEADPDVVLALFKSAAGQPLAIFGSFSLHADSLNYQSVIAQTLGKLHGPELVTLWSTGAGANVSSFEDSRRIGTILAGEAIKAGARAGKIGAAAKLGVTRETVKLGSFEAEVQVIALGDSLAWVGLPGELWTELGSAIRKASPFPQTLLVGLANGSAGVLPTRKGYPDPSVRAIVGSGEAVADAAVRLLAGARRLAARP
jgi:neutral ceramidase